MASTGGEQSSQSLKEELDPKVTARLLGLEFREKLDAPKPPRDLKRGDFDRIVGSWGKQYSTVPIDGDERFVTVATADPLNVNAMDELRVCYGREIRPIVTSPEEISKAINAIRTNLMSNRSSALDDEDEQEGDEVFQNQLKIDVTDAEDDDAPIIRYVNSIVFKANAERASDIHIEPYETALKVRFRVDGVLSDVDTQEKAFHAAIVSRIKVMAGLNIAEKRLPQDGRIGLKIAGKEVDLRVSSIPTQFGERIVMRVLDKSSGTIDLDQLGFDTETLSVIEQLINRPHGIILVTGPTGSGKTTTLYGCLSKIKSPGLNILTVEDPIEYQIEGLSQMQVNPKINFTFAAGLRSILRQDPDVVMVGEIRDAETAEIAIQASLTGHLVFSTLHTNDAPTAITRLVDIGIEPFLVSSSLLAVMGQRLLRKLCPVCREEYTISDQELRGLGIQASQVKNRNVFRPGTKHCELCQNTGYRGRAGIHELLLMDDEIRTLVVQRSDASAIRNIALTKGFKTLRMDGAAKVFSGITSVEEVLRVTMEDLA